MKIRGNQGFTIIELIVVIIILGILAAVALPRFMDATERAHDASVIGAKGALASGVQMLRAQWYANGNSVPDSENGVNGFGDGNMSVNTRGWAISWSGTSPNSVATDGDYPANGATEFSTYTGYDKNNCSSLFNGILNTGSIKVVSESASDLGKVDGYISAFNSTDTTCEYTYGKDGSPERKIIYAPQTGNVTVSGVQTDPEEAS